MEGFLSAAEEGVDIVAGRRGWMYTRCAWAAYQGIGELGTAVAAHVRKKSCFGIVEQAGLMRLQRSSVRVAVGGRGNNRRPRSQGVAAERGAYF